MYSLDLSMSACLLIIISNKVLLEPSLLFPLGVLIHFQLHQVLNHMFIFLLGLQLPTGHHTFQIAALENPLDDAGHQHAGSTLTIFWHPGQVDCIFISTILVTSTRSRRRWISFIRCGRCWSTA